MSCATLPVLGLPALPSTLRCAPGESLTLAPVQASAPCPSRSVLRSPPSPPSLKSVRPSCLLQPPSDSLAWPPASPAVGPNAAPTLSSLLLCSCAPTIPQGASSMPLSCPPQPEAVMPGAFPPLLSPATGSIPSTRSPTPDILPLVCVSASIPTAPPGTSPSPYAPKLSVLFSPPALVSPFSASPCFPSSSLLSPRSPV